MKRVNIGDQHCVGKTLIKVMSISIDDHGSPIMAWCAVVDEGEQPVGWTMAVAWPDLPSDMRQEAELAYLSELYPCGPPDGWRPRHE